MKKIIVFILVALFSFGCKDEPFCVFKKKQNGWELYHLNGKVKSFKKVIWYLTEDSIGNFNKSIKPLSQEYFEFNDEGDLISNKIPKYTKNDTIFWIEKEKIINCENDLVGNIIFEGYKLDNFQYYTEYKYDNCGNKIQEKRTANDDFSIYKYYYNSNNRVIRISNKLEKDSIIRLRYKYYRDEKGDLKEKHTLDNTGEIWRQIKYDKREFDRVGNWTSLTETWGLKGESNYGEEIPIRKFEREITYFEE